MSFNTKDLNRLRGIDYDKELKEVEPIFDKLLKGKDVHTKEIELLHQVIESVWYGEKQIRGEW